MDQSIDYPQIDSYSNYPPVDLSNYASLSHPPIDLSSYTTSSYPSVNLSNDAFLIHAPIDTTLSYPPVNLLNYKSLNHPPIDLSNNASLSQKTLIPKAKKKSKKCKRCKKIRAIKDEIDQICYPCYKAKTATPSGNEVIDNFIKSTLINSGSRRIKLEFVPYDRFKDIEFIAEGGFSKIYKATWIDGPMKNKWNEEKQEFARSGKMIVALKELNNSENIDSKELHEVQYPMLI